MPDTAMSLAEPISPFGTSYYWVSTDRFGKPSGLGIVLETKSHYYGHCTYSAVFCHFFEVDVAVIT